jgi:N-acetylneuraminic acid mutarotase
MKKNHFSLKFRLLEILTLLGTMLMLGLLAPTYIRSSAFSPHAQSLPLSFAERVSYERKLQTVYFKHRIYPESNQQRQPTLDEVLPLDTTRAKVEDVLRKANALERVLNVKITPAMLQAEIERMSRETRQPTILRELWKALDNDPHLVAECLARPILVERLIRANKTDADDWWATVKNSFPSEISEQFYSYTLPEIGARGDFADDTWKPLPTLPDGFFEHTMVWTGAEMLVWGGTTTGSFTSRTNAGSRYNPATDSWSPITGSGAPQPRRAHTAVWTGTEMIVWGGCGPSTQFCGLSSGGRYNPATDSWLPTSTTNLPNPRLDHTAVWTGDRMIVFGGCNPNANFTSCPSRNDGGMYFPATDTWVATSLTNAPTARRNHTAVWTGTEMLIWGGFSNVGGRFNPNTNSWTTMNAANAPDSRERHTAVWTGTEMIVWGGSVSTDVKLNTGGRYNPTSDSWTPTNTANAPEARYLHTGVWTGTEMIVWGGNTATLGENYLNTGGKYNPATDVWTATNTATAPLPRDRHQAIWTGSEMIVWGGRRDVTGKTGGRYNPATDSWIAVSTNDAPSNTDAKAVWTGTEMIIWGGAFTNRGAKYNPATSVWSPIANATGLEQRDRGFMPIWTGTEMLVWGGQTGSVVLDTGGRYNPATDAWTLISTANAPSERSYHTTVWTGSEMIIWGGTDGAQLNNGGRYNPSTNTWLPVTTASAPAARYLHTAVFVGGKMVVWGGATSSTFLNTGGRYEPSTNSWQQVSTVNAPEPRINHTAISTGMEMIVWGGSQFQFGSSFFNNGGRYNPTTDVWTPTSLTNAPAPRALHTAVWTGTEMIVWGGNLTDALLGSNTGGRYNPATNSWRATSTFRAGTERSDHVAVWTGRSMIIWGGNVRAGSARAGYEYFANGNAPTMFDFDGDAKSDISVFRPSNATWYLNQSASGFTAVQFGLSSDKIVPADYDGDGKTDVAVYRDGAWYILSSSNNAFNAQQFGQSGDVPLPGDYDGDGKADITVYRPAAGTFYLLHSSDNSFHFQQWGQAGDLPVMGDYDGDGKTDFAVFRPSTSTYYILQSSNGVVRGEQFGQSGDKPIAADFDGDGKTDIGVYRPTTSGWYYLQSTDNSFRGITWGTSGDIPSAGDYDGDTKTDVAVFRPSSGTFYILQSTNSSLRSEQFGANGDVPVSSAYVP